MSRCAQPEGLQPRHRPAASAGRRSGLRPCGSGCSRWYRRQRARPAVAADARPVRDPRQRGDAAADAGRARHPALRALARALADGRRARGRAGGRRDRRVAGARLQPARGQPAPRGAHVAEHGWPDDLTELPGVGPYTAAAVGNFAFGRDVLPVDTNVRRVQERTGERFDGACAQALFDLGATVCLARVPRCGACPLADGCPSRGPRYEPLRKQSRVRGLVPAAPRASRCARSPRGEQPGRRRGARVARARRARRARGRARFAAGVTREPGSGRDGTARVGDGPRERGLVGDDAVDAEVDERDQLAHLVDRPGTTRRPAACAVSTSSRVTRSRRGPSVWGAAVGRVGCLKRNVVASARREAARLAEHALLEGAEPIVREVRRERARERPRRRVSGGRLRLDEHGRTAARQRLVERQPGRVAEVRVVRDDELASRDADVDLDRGRARREEPAQRQLGRCRGGPGSRSSRPTVAPQTASGGNRRMNGGYVSVNGVERLHRVPHPDVRLDVRPMPSAHVERREHPRDDVVAVRGERIPVHSSQSATGASISIDSGAGAGSRRRPARARGSTGRSASRRRAATRRSARSGSADSAPSASGGPARSARAGPRARAASRIALEHPCSRAAAADGPGETEIASARQDVGSRPLSIPRSNASSQPGGRSSSCRPRRRHRVQLGDELVAVEQRELEVREARRRAGPSTRSPGALWCMNSGNVAARASRSGSLAQVGPVGVADELHQRSSSATACAASPSPRPVKPRPVGRRRAHVDLAARRRASASRAAHLLAVRRDPRLLADQHAVGVDEPPARRRAPARTPRAAARATRRRGSARRRTGTASRCRRAPRRRAARRSARARARRRRSGPRARAGGRTRRRRARAARRPRARARRRRSRRGGSARRAPPAARRASGSGSPAGGGSCRWPHGPRRMCTAAHARPRARAATSLSTRSPTYAISLGRTAARRRRRARRTRGAGFSTPQRADERERRRRRLEQVAPAHCGVLPDATDAVARGAAARRGTAARRRRGRPSSPRPPPGCSTPSMLARRRSCGSPRARARRARPSR